MVFYEAKTRTFLKADDCDNPTKQDKKLHECVK